MKYQTISTLIMAAVLALTIPGTSPALASTVHICAASNHAFHTMVGDTIKEAYRRIGYTVEFTWLPNRRSLIEADLGKCDGEMMRIDGVNRKFKNLLPVFSPVAYLEGVAFMNLKSGPKPKIKNWRDLENLETAIIIGELYAERGTQDFRVGEVKTYTQLFTMLENGHIDAGVGIREVGQVELSRHFPNATIQVNSDVLAQSPMFHYVHKNNQHLIEKLEHAFAAMDKEGVIEKLNTQALEKLLNSP